MMRREEFSARVIYVGADEQLAGELQDTIEAKPGWTVQRVVDVETALVIRSEHKTSVAVLSVEDEISFSQSLRFLRAVDCTEMPAVVIGNGLSAQQLLQLLQLGVSECLDRPVNFTRLSLVLDMLTASHRTKEASQEQSKPSGQVQACGWHERLMDQVRAVASLNTTVLITGETGTGKTRLSRVIHGLSPRQSKPFLAVNCGALSESLLDSELFGHVRGAFTGADQNYAGKLAQCRDGTLLLDEIDTLSPAAQIKLLQVVEDRVFQPVGSAKFQPLEARLIVASNRPLEKEVAEGRFRSDLFYRLNVMAFQLPPLRARRHEIRQLASAFAEEFAHQHGFPAATISEKAVAALESYDWPGNIRELRNVMERAVILSAGSSIELSHLPPQVVQTDVMSATDADDVAAGGNKLAHARVEAEREALLNALERNDNNRSKTALDLGISRVALYKRLHKLHIL